MLKMPPEAEYPLSSLQQGLLFNTLYAPQSGVDLIQVVCTLPEELQVEKFEQAWQRIGERYAVLRTAFRWEDVPEVQQQVYPTSPLPLTYQDWRKVLPADRPAQLENFLRADRLLSFNIAEPPLVRLTLCQLAQASYYFIFTFHHLILDGRSLLILFKEAFAFYEALCQGADLQLPLPTPYQAYINWLQQQDPTPESAFWRQWLKGFTEPTPISVQKSFHPVVKDSPGYAEYELRLSPITTTTLKTLAQTYHFTLNTLLQGAWALLLSHYTQRLDVVFGTTWSCRRATVAGADSIGGLVINTLPMRVRLSPEENLLQWLQEIRAQHRALREHLHASLMQIPFWSEVPKETPLFDHLVIFENFSLQSALQALGGKWTRREFQLRRQPNSPLTVYGFDEPALVIKLLYDRACFTVDQIQRLAGHLQTILEGIAAQPNSCLRDVPLLTAAERHQLFNEWNAAQTAGPPARCLQDYFTEQAQRRPEAIALAFENQQLTYGELNARANRLAHYLRTLGVKPETLVGICADPSLDLVVGLLGILKAGGAYVPLNPTYPPERLAFMLKDTQASLVLTQAHLIEKLPADSAQFIRLDTALKVSSTLEASSLAGWTMPENLAYVIYTSGSTGQPKGVQVTHANVARLLAATQPQFQFDAEDVWTLFHSYAFDFSVWEIWGALLSGGQLVIVPFEVSRSPEAFHDLLHRKHVTILNQTPSAFYQLIHVDETVESHQRFGLRWIILGGEALQLQHLKPWFTRHGDHQPQLVNMYGITETTVHVTYCPLRLADLNESAESPIGRPISGWQLYLLDQYQQPVPVGIPGQLYVGGAGVTRGYLNQPELTADRFMPNPFRHLPGDALYRSGDLARYLPNGDLEYLGRMDQQVKLRGFRIELGEIEAVLSQHETVQTCAVTAQTVTADDQRLIAYLVPKTSSASVSELRQFLKARLPDYMLPAAFVFLSTQPLTSNGKLDRRALPLPDEGNPSGAPFQAPRTPIEKTLAEIWAEVLRVEPVGIQDSFFELGGHSLIATRLMARVRQAFNMELSLRVLFETRTIEGMAQAIQAQQENNRPYVGIRAASNETKHLLAKVDQLSDEEVENLLSEFFRETGK